MVPILFSSEKLNKGRISSLAFFGSEWESLASDLVTNITLEEREHILPGVAKMTLIVPKEGLGGAFP